MKNPILRWHLIFRLSLGLLVIGAFSGPILAETASGNADSGQDRLGVKMSELLADSKSGFYLLRFNGRKLIEEPLQVLSREGSRMVVGLLGIPTPRFVFRVNEEPDFLAIHLEEAQGDFSGREVTLCFGCDFKQKLQAIPLDY
ncbi:MAG: hypothetical protein WCH43_12910, partial [Verrucomicrobiota bacterium]